MTGYDLRTKILQHMLRIQRESDHDIDGSIFYKENGLYRPTQIGVGSAKGGVGKTTLASWIAYLSAKSGLKTALVEFNWINNPNLAATVYQDIKDKTKIKSFVTKDGIHTSSFSKSISCPTLIYYLIRYSDWKEGRTIDTDEETIETQKKIISSFRNSDFNAIVYDFPNYASKPKGLISLMDTDHRIIVTERGDAAMGTVPKIVQNIINLTKDNYLEETEKQKLLVINRIDEESSTLRRLIAKSLKEERIDKAHREFTKLKKEMPKEDFFGEYVYFIQEFPTIREAAGPGNIMSINGGEEINQFKVTTQNLLADIITHAINYQKKEKTKGESK